MAQLNTPSLLLLVVSHTNTSPRTFPLRFLALPFSSPQTVPFLALLSSSPNLSECMTGGVCVCVLTYCISSTKATAAAGLLNKR